MTVRWDIIPAGERKVESLDAGAADAGLRPHALAGPDAMNLSAAYALAFCAGVYFPARLAWWLPLVTLFVSDLAIDLYYYYAHHVEAFNSPSWSIISFMPCSSGWDAGSVPRLVPEAFERRNPGRDPLYLITNTASWLVNPFHNPEYTRTFAGWLTALSKGTAGYPPTWEFFRNTLIGGGLFTGLFAGVMKLGEAAESTGKRRLRKRPRKPANRPANLNRRRQSGLSRRPTVGGAEDALMRRRANDPCRK